MCPSLVLLRVFKLKLIVLNFQNIYMIHFCRPKKVMTTTNMTNLKIMHKAGKITITLKSMMKAIPREMEKFIVKILEEGGKGSMYRNILRR